MLPTTGYHLTARFGMSGGLWSSNHTGLDFAAPSGTPIVAVANGTITETGYDGAYGNKTVETLEDGTEIWYCHQSAIGVHAGDRDPRRPADRHRRQRPATSPAPTSTSRSAPVAATRWIRTPLWSSTGSRPESSRCERSGRR